MTDSQTISWIFVSIALASQKEPASFDGISSVADGINHAVPTHKELQSSITWLTNRGLIEKIGNRYKLTSKGKEEYVTSSKINNLVSIWKACDARIQELY